MTVSKSSFYVFLQKISSAGLQPDFSHIANDPRSGMDCHLKPLPDGFAYNGPLLLGSPKPPGKSYDIAGDHIVSERLAAVISDVAGGEVRLVPYVILPNPKSKYSLTGKYYHVEMPFIECIQIEYGAEQPTSDLWRKRAEAEGQSIPATYRPVIRKTFDMDKVSGINLFKSTTTEIGGFMSEKLRSACKRAKIIGMINMTSDYSFHLSVLGLNDMMARGEGDLSRI